MFGASSGLGAETKVEIPLFGASTGLGAETKVKIPLFGASMGLGALNKGKNTFVWGQHRPGGRNER
ncbi:hypothetical protein PGRAT_03200 [Paenibacillus graminis]|uniref:Uncharacterized protein n=1 Tax=Paenibacillus graminis TaxID=189425 RepID=A0A089M5J4_9BACL|nr:hypothetical protein PGRAT_03200 [Paenibacillus graminis]